MENRSPAARPGPTELSALKDYALDHAYDEMFTGPGELHEHYGPLLEHFGELPPDELQRRKQAAEAHHLDRDAAGLNSP